MTRPHWQRHCSADALADAVAADVMAIIAATCNDRGRAVLALPGGQTPVPVYERLAAAAIDWTKVTILPTDERLVAPGDVLSNMRLLENYFGKFGARIIPLVTTPGDYRAAADLANSRLQALDWPLDLVWLGMGSDGHTASLFAGPDLDRALDATCRVVGVRPDPLPREAPVDRVSLSATAIRAAHRLMIVITGEAKHTLLERALAEGGTSPLPIGRLLACANSRIDIHWSPA